MAKYVHTLLFACPNCKLPIAISQIREEGNVEDVDSIPLKIKCTHCEKSSNVIAASAKNHYVDAWPFEDWP
jgi:hypothetical protein